LEHQAKRDALHTRFSKALNDNNLDELRQIIVDEEIVCPISGTKNWNNEPIYRGRDSGSWHHRSPALYAISDESPSILRLVSA